MLLFTLIKNLENYKFEFNDKAKVQLCAKYIKKTRLDCQRCLYWVLKSTCKTRITKTIKNNSYYQSPQEED